MVKAQQSLGSGFGTGSSAGAGVNDTIIHDPDFIHWTDLESLGQDASSAFDTASSAGPFRDDVIMQNPSSVPGENFEIVYQNPSRVFDTASSAGVARNNDTMHDAYIVPKKKRAYTKRKPKSTAHEDGNQIGRMTNADSTSTTDNSRVGDVTGQYTIWGQSVWPSQGNDYSPEEHNAFKYSVPAGVPCRSIFPDKNFVPPQNLDEMDTVPHSKSTLLYILGLYPSPPASASRNKSTYESRIDLAKVIDKDPRRHTEGGVLYVMEENYLYAIVPSIHRRGYYMAKRSETLNLLHSLFDSIAQANLDRVAIAVVKEKVDREAAVKQLRVHQTKLTVEGFHEFALLMKTQYDERFDRVVRAWKHHTLKAYYHPRDRLVKDGQSKNVHQQLRTFVEQNNNSWSMTDYQDPSIVYSSKGAFVLAGDAVDLPFDERTEMDFPAAAPRADQPGLADFDEAVESMIRGYNFSNKSYRDWEAYSRSVIEKLGDKLLAEYGITIHFSNRSSKLLVKVKENPLERTLAFFKNNKLAPMEKEDFRNVLYAIQVQVAKERQDPSSLYSIYQRWKRDLALRQLRREISEKLQVKWYFVLQHIPPLELKPRTTHCAHPSCKYHEHELMPAGAYRLNFMHKCMLGEPKYWLQEAEEESALTPGRAENGQMWFCLTCIQDLFNGIGLIDSIDGNNMGDKTKTVTEDNSRKVLWRLPNNNIEAEWHLRMKRSAAAHISPEEQQGNPAGDAKNSVMQAPEIPTITVIYSASRKSADDTQKNVVPQIPEIKPTLMAPGLDVFAASLYTFIKPELRYTSTEFYTLNPYEYYAFMKWKNMCIRKSMWEIPSNRKFMRQTPDSIGDYDFDDFFGDDILDEYKRLPATVAGTDMVLDPVNVDDISTWKGKESFREPNDGNIGNAGTRVVHPLSDIMALVDERVRNKWADMDPPFVPRESEDPTDVLDRKWPLHEFWRSCFEKEIEEARQVELQEVIDRNDRVIEEGLKALGIKTRTRQRPGPYLWSNGESMEE